MISTKYLKKNLYESFSKSSKKSKRRDYFKFILQGHYPDIKARQRKTLQERKLQANISDEYRSKNLLQNTNEQNSTACESIIGNNNNIGNGIYPEEARITKA